MFYILARKTIGDIRDLNNTRMRVTHRFGMHQTSYNRYNPNGYGSFRVTPIACGLEAPRPHGKIRFFIHLLLSYSPIRSYYQQRFAKNMVDFQILSTHFF